MSDVDCVVVGAGVVGLAVARRLAAAGFVTIVLDGETRFGSWTSSRNSEVIHAGIYYPPGSLKARLCVEGRERLYHYCRERQIPHRMCGKLIVAQEKAQEDVLRDLMEVGSRNGVHSLRPVDHREVGALEPSITAASGLLSPETGIIDSHALMLSFLADIEHQGGTLVCRTRVERLERSQGRWAVICEGMPDPLLADVVVNSAGLAASDLADATEGLEPGFVPRTRFAKGVYFTYQGRTPFSRLIYPVPEPGGLGTHLTLDLAGQARFGPDVEWIDRVDYEVDPGRRQKFSAAIARYWPAVETDRLVPAYAGVRPKISGPEAKAADFLISGPEDHGLPGLVNLFGIESPGLTSSMAIAEHVHGLVRASA